MIPSVCKRAGLYLLIGALGFGLGVAGLSIDKIRSGPCLEPWHTAELTAEFSVRRAEEIASFEDYLRLEDELFAQLEEQVYARIGTGPAYALMRYSSGSLADPGRWKRNWNRSFEFPVAEPTGGVLLLHGMSDSPYSLRALGEALSRHGYWVVGLRLPGHGTVPSGLKSVSWQDMAAAVRLGMDRLAAKVGPEALHIVGYSNGAALAVDFTLEVMDGETAPVPKSLVLISPAIGVTPMAALAKWKRRMGTIPGLEKAAWSGVEPEFDPFKYNSFTTNAGEQVYRLTRRLARAVEARAGGSSIGEFPSTLVFLSAVDATVSVDAVVDNLLEHLAPERHELVLYDINREKVAESVLVADPGPLTARLMADDALPFALTLITNEDNESSTIVSRSKAPLSSEVATTAMDASWPSGMISLSHVALPFPLDDSLYGRGPAPSEETIFLGHMEVRGERGLLRFPADWLMRLRHNPFYDYQEARVIAWIGGEGAIGQLREAEKYLPTPYTAEQIRHAWQVGFEVTTRMRNAEGETYSRTRVVEWTEEGFRMLERAVDAAGAPVGEEETVSSGTWVELRDHARFPSSAANRERARRDTPLGELEGWLYRVRGDDGEAEFFFADALPGPPVVYRQVGESGEGFVAEQVARGD